METVYSKVIAEFKKSYQEGLTILYKSYGEYLYQYSASRWNLNEDDCYEVLYKTLESVGKVIDRYEFDSENHFRNWLFKIHKNNTFKLVHSRKFKEGFVFTRSNWENEIGDYKIAEESSGELTDTLITDNFIQLNPYEEHSESNRLYSAMEKALTQISSTERDILLLRMSNYSYDEIATMLGVENNQLKVKFLRAKAKVQKKTMSILKDSSHENTN